MPAQHSCCSSSHLWHKGLAEPYNVLCSHRHSAAQAVLQTLAEAHRREIFCPSLVYTALSVANVSQTRQVHWSHYHVPAWARKSPQHEPKHNQFRDRVARSLTTNPSHNHMTSAQAFTQVSQTQLWCGSEGVGWNLLGCKSAPSTAEWQPVLHKHFMQIQGPA